MKESTNKIAVCAATPATPSSGKHLGIIMLTMMTAALFLTLRSVPMMAATGLQIIFFNLITVFAFLVPVALVAAELATTWPKNGVFHWVSEAYGTGWGFTAVWLQWIQSIFGIASILAFIAASLSFAIVPSLAHNRWFIFIVILIVYWLATFINMRGTRASGIISTVCLSTGVLFPIAILAGLTILYIANGHTIRINLALTPDNWLPINHPGKHLLLFLGFIFSVTGIEVSANHAREVRNVRKNYPIAIFSAAVLGFFLTLIAGLAVAVVVPVGQLNMVSGTMQALQKLLGTDHVKYLEPLFAIIIAFGAAGQVSTWVLGPVKGIWASARTGLFPKMFQEANQHGVPRNLLYLQAVLMSMVAVLIFLIPSINTAFLLLTSLAVVLYSCMYILFFSAAIKLRYSQPSIERPYRIPGGKNWGLWIVAGTGFLTTSACLFIGLIPPGHMNYMEYDPVMIGLILLMIFIPLILHQRHKRYRSQDSSAA